MSIVEKTAYQIELLSLLRASTLVPGTYRPTPAVIGATHAAVLVGDKPVILCGPADDPASIRQAQMLANSRRFAAGARTAGHEGTIRAGTVPGALVAWSNTMTAIVEKSPGEADVGDGPLVAIVLNDPSKTFAAYLCVTTETARALDPNAPELDDGFLGELARANRPMLH